MRRYALKDRLLDIPETAQVLGRTENAVRRMIKRRQLPFRKSGRRVLVLESELRAFIEALPELSLEDLREREKAGV
jgi:excisionase family DNA binding protein